MPGHPSLLCWVKEKEGANSYAFHLERTGAVPGALSRVIPELFTPSKMVGVKGEAHLFTRFTLR